MKSDLKVVSNLDTSNVTPHEVFGLDPNISPLRTAWGAHSADKAVCQMAGLWKEENNHKPLWIAYYAYANALDSATDPDVALKRGEPYVERYLEHLQRWFSEVVTDALVHPREAIPKADPRRLEDVVPSSVTMTLNLVIDGKPHEVVYRLDPTTIRITENRRVEHVRNLSGEVVEMRPVHGSHTLSVKAKIKSEEP